MLSACNYYILQKLHLAVNAPIVECPLFESAVEKIQGGLEHTLTKSEKHAMKDFLKVDQPGSDSDDSSEDCDDGYADKIIRDARSSKVNRLSSKESAYRPLNHIKATSNCCERLFSQTKMIMRPHRSSMVPWHLELLVFLRVNKELWDVSTVQDMINNVEPAAESTPLTPSRRPTSSIESPSPSPAARRSPRLSLSSNTSAAFNSSNGRVSSVQFPLFSNSSSSSSSSSSSRGAFYYSSSSRQYQY